MHQHGRVDLSLSPFSLCFPHPHPDTPPSLLALWAVLASLGSPSSDVRRPPHLRSPRDSPGHWSLADTVPSLLQSVFFPPLGLLFILFYLFLSMGVLPVWVFCLYTMRVHWLRRPEGAVGTLGTGAATWVLGV